MLICVVAIIFLRIRAFKKGFKNTINGYSDPDETARDLVAKARKGTDPKFKAYLDIKNLQHIIKLNLSYLSENSIEKSNRKTLFLRIFLFILNSKANRHFQPRSMHRSNA